jgi:hypothetical protein
MFDAYKRKGLNVDVSYSSATWGAPTQGRYFYQQQSIRFCATRRNEPHLGNTNARPKPAPGVRRIKTDNLANFGKSACQGRYGYFIVGSKLMKCRWFAPTSLALVPTPGGSTPADAQPGYSF